jgi:AraC-like DNA-binding protein
MYGKSENADDYQHIPRPITALAVDYPANHRIPPHHHPRAQLIYAATGVVVAHTAQGRWVIPPLRAVWMPAHTTHWLHILERSEMRTLYLEPGAAPHLPPTAAVIHIPPLLRELILAAVRIPLVYKLKSRDSLLMQLILHELHATPVPALHLPMPTDRRLLRICTALLENPAANLTIIQWSKKSAMSPKTFERLFLRQTSLTFGRWRQQARLLASLPLLARGDSILGYHSPSAFTAMFRTTLGITPSRYFQPPLQPKSQTRPI